jgi:hypothetical protein
LPTTCWPDCAKGTSFGAAGDVPKFVQPRHEETAAFAAVGYRAAR